MIESRRSSPPSLAPPRLAFLTDSFSGEFQSTLFKAAADAATEYGFQLIAVHGGMLRNPRQRASHFAFDLLGPDNVDAVLVSGHSISQRSSRAELQSLVDRLRPLPLVCLGVELEGVSCSVVDNEAGAHAVVSHLVRFHGCRQIAFLGGYEGSVESQARYAGYERALLEAGLEVDPALLWFGDFERASGERAAERLLAVRQQHPVDAIACANDEMAIGVLRALEARGVEVPRQLAVVGFDDMPFARHAEAPLTTVRQPLEAQIRSAVRQLAEAVRSGSQPPRLERLEAELVIRQSCGCARHLAPNVPSQPPFGPDRDFAGRVAARTPELVAVARSAGGHWFEEVESGRAESLIGAFVEQLARDSAAFTEQLEQLGRRALSAGASGSLQDVVEALRDTVSSWALGDRRATLRIGAVIAEALAVTHALGAAALAKRGDELTSRVLALSQLTSDLLATPDFDGLGASLRSLDRVGIGVGCVALLVDSERAVGEAIIVIDPERGAPPVLRFPVRELAPPGFLAGRSVALLPLTHHDEALGWALMECGSDGVVYELLRQALGAALRGARYTRRVSELALRDPLTGLFNRRHFATRLELELARAAAESSAVSLLSIDLDGFKRVNDQRGHDAGDCVLVAVAARLTEVVRSSDVVARMGGDEFVVLAPDTNEREASRLATRLVEALGALDSDGWVGASVGHATAVGSAATSTTLFHQADQALLAAKAGGKRRAVAFGSAEPRE